MVRDYYWHILAVVLFFSSYFTVRFIEPSYAGVSSLFMILFAVPSFYFLYLHNGKKAVISIILVSLFAYGIETLGLLTGFPYSEFSYTSLIGLKIFGITPVFLPFSFVPLVIGTMYLARSYKHLQVVVSAALLVAVDFMLDPAAVHLGLWVWENPGWYYGIPWVNFAGWLLAGLIASWLLSGTTSFRKESCYSLYLIMAFWTGACLWMQLWVPLVIGMLFLVVIIRSCFLNKVFSQLNHS